MLTKSYLTDLTYQITGGCIEVHKALGPGLLEKTYHRLLMHEYALRGLSFDSEVWVTVPFKGIIVDTELRCDLLIEKSIVVELKAVETLLPIHEAQLLTYMKLLDVLKGILINFNVLNLYKDGQRTFVNEKFRHLPD